MTIVLRLLPLLWLVLLAPAAAAAQGYTGIHTQAVTVCPGDGTSTPPDFTAGDCETLSFWTVDPQGREVWIRGTLEIPAEMLRPGGPLGFYVSAMASSEFWINGIYLGANGRPSAIKRLETPGQMDAVIYLPRALLQPGANEITGRLSSHHGFLQVRNPLHIIAVGPFADPTRRILSAYTPSLFNLGAFLLGFIFFGVTAMRGEDRAGSTLLSLLSLTAGAQLLVEAGRGLVAYEYPMHDWRIFLIVLTSASFGLLLVAYLLHRFSGLSPAQQILRLGAVLLLQTGLILLTPGYDGKAGYAFLGAAVCGMAWTGLWSWQNKPGARIYLAILVMFTALLLVFGGQFLDTYFFFAVTGLLLFLFWQQALALIRARRDKRAEEHRAAQLEVALAQARQKSSPDQIQLVSSGRVDYIATDTIVQLKGAGDYVEVFFETGRTALYNGGLTQLESELPPTFLRVHRSHIVNTAFVSALERDTSGVGRLLLSDGTAAPVSRRILPKVRSALAES